MLHQNYRAAALRNQSCGGKADAAVTASDNGAFA
jgi:hypothetical protein